MDAAPVESAAELAGSLAAYATERCSAVRVEVRWLGIEPSRLAEGGSAGFEGDPCRPNPTLGLTWAVGLDSSRFTVRPELEIWVGASVAARPVAAGGRIEAVDGVVQLGELSPGAWAGGEAVAIRAIRAGEPLTRANAAPVADAESGASVRIRVVSGSLQIWAEGRLLHSASVGEVVRVHNDATNAVVRGVLVAPDTVEL